MSQRVWMKWIVAVAGAILTTCAAQATEATVAGDAYVNSAHPSTNYGNLSNLYVGNGGTALIQFDLSSLPSGATATQIGKATVKLYVNRVNASGAISVLPVTSAWNESTVTYATIPSLGASIASFTPTMAEQFIVIDITSLVQSWITTPASNFGIALTSPAGNVVLDSKENDETSHVAHLDITVVSQGPAGPQGPQGIQGATGAQGPQGIQGSAGATGAAGPIGPTGLTGATGPTGPIGLAGPQGIQGSAGTTGAAGPIGPTGLTGATGPAGPIGLAGPQGIQGVVGPAGATGAQGPPVSFRNAWSSSISYSIGDAVSENGTSYIALRANVSVDPATDVAGSGGNWAVLAAAGATGAQGTQGVPGPAGTNGTNGTNGSVGPQGPAGPAGPAGPVATFKGAYDASTVYYMGDAVSENGSSYVALANNLNVDPASNPTVWAVLAAKGGTGATGTIGAVTEYASSTTYSLGQVVFCNTTCATNGSSYISLLASNTGHDPSANPSDWQIIARVGAQGQLGTAATVGIGTVSTGAAGSSASVTNGGTSNAAVLNFSIPEGAPGTAATVGVGTVSTGAPGSSATVTNGGSSSAAVLNFTIPQGATGSIGAATEWASGTTYAVGNVVFCNTTCATNGSSYVSLIAGNTGHDPSANPSDWQMIASVGAPGTAGAAATVGIGTVSTGAAGSSASVTNGGTSNAAVLNFSIPKGDTGTAATVGVGTVSTGAPGSSATVTNGGSSSAAVLNFTIPQGATGSIGAATEWASGTTYAVGNVVFCNTTCAANGSSYVSLIAGNTGLDPSATPADWQMIAKVGSQGLPGANGSNGTNGTNGTNGVVQGITANSLNTATAGAGTASISGTAANPAININFPNDVQSVSASATNSASAGTGTASVSGTATNPTININFPKDVESVTAGTVTTSGATGSLTIGGSATNPTIGINFPASSGSSSGNPPLTFATGNLAYWGPGTYYVNFQGNLGADGNGDSVFSGTYLPSACTASKFTVATDGTMWDSTGKVVLQIISATGVSFAHGSDSSGWLTNLGTITGETSLSGFDCTITNASKSCTVTPTSVDIPAGSFLTIRAVISGNTDGNPSLAAPAVTGDPQNFYISLTCQ
jgi:hypothetical protein